MSKGQLVITAVAVEGRSKSEVARDYDVSRQWVQQLCRRYATEGATAFEPRSRRPQRMPELCAATSKTASFGSAKTSPSKASTPAPKPSPPTSPQTHHQRACGIHDLAHPDR